MLQQRHPVPFLTGLNRILFEQKQMLRTCNYPAFAGNARMAGRLIRMIDGSILTESKR